MIKKTVCPFFIKKKKSGVGCKGIYLGVPGEMFHLLKIKT